MNSVWIIIAINFAMYIVVSFSSASFSRDIITQLGLVPLLVWDRPWTIVTNMFIHAGFWHIFTNMLTLYFFGTFLSRLAGQGMFLWVYFGGGILGNIIYVLMGEPYSIAVGASGAVFALAGALVMMAPNLKVYVFPLPAPMPLWVAVIGIFVILTALAGWLHIAWQAHLGGLAAGLFAGFSLRKKQRYRYYG